MGVVLTFNNGVTVRQGEKYDLPEFHDLQRMVMPVVSIQHGEVRCWGTAVCIGAGWFVTARHVISDLRDDGAEDVFVIWETDTDLDGHGTDFLGAPLRVRTWHLHDEADLATLTAELPHQGASEIRKMDWSLRIPRLGEPVTVVGYSHLKGSISVQPTGRMQLAWERILSIGVGAVLEQRIERRGIGLRQSAGFSTDAPALAGMSGGPVIDRHGSLLGFVSSSFEPATGVESWNSFVALAGPALELSVTDLPLGLGLDITDAPNRRLATLMTEGAFDGMSDATFDVIDGKATYSINE